MKEKDAAALSAYQDLMQYHRVRVTWKVRPPRIGGTLTLCDQLFVEQGKWPKLTVTSVSEVNWDEATRAAGR